MSWLTIIIPLLVALCLLFVGASLLHTLTRTFLDSFIPWRRQITAEAKARTLMRDVLRPHEFQQISRFGYLDIPSPHFPSRTYRIPGGGGLVKVFDHGCAIMELCLQPVEPLPDGDVVVMHKLFIETSEEEYLQRANRFAPGIIAMRYPRF